MNERMNNWINEWMYEQMNERMNEWTYERMNEKSLNELKSRMGKNEPKSTYSIKGLALRTKWK